MLSSRLSFAYVCVHLQRLLLLHRDGLLSLVVRRRERETEMAMRALGERERERELKYLVCFLALCAWSP